MIWSPTILISLLVASQCIQFSFVRSGPVSNPAPEDDRKASDLRKHKNKNNTKIDDTEFIIKAFSSILISKLENNKIVLSLFVNPVDKDFSVYMAAAISESLVLEVGLADSYSSINIIVDALLSVNPKAGPKAYCTKLGNVIAKILISNQILNSDNYFTLAHTVNRILLNIASDSLDQLGNVNKKRKDTTTTNLDIATRTDIGIDAAAGLDLKANTGLDAATNVDIDLGAAVEGNVGLDVSNQKFKNNVGHNTNAKLKANSDINPALGINTNVGLPALNNLNPTTNSGINIDLKLSEEANLIFKSELTSALLKDRNFRYVFSDGVPSNALKHIAAAICQYISKAFAISRSFLLPLENSIGNLSLDLTPCPEQYASIITGMLANVFSQAKFLTKSTASLQAIIASNAITSGIENFISISTIPGAGFSFNDNVFNSYFSILNGLEKLPYVGVEAASSKLPLSVKLVYASMYASQFFKLLFSNLVSSAKFLEAFSLCVPAYNYKIIARSLGIFVAEAFGSPNSNLFYDLYAKALLTPSININSVNYAKILSTATTRALYLSGYFLSGNINVQAAIAKNAIIRALTSKLRPLSIQVVLFPNILSLSWITQLEEASPTQILLKYGTDVGLNVGVNSGSGLGLDEGTNSKLNSALGAGVNTNTALGSGININTGIGADLGVNVGLGGGLGTNIGLDGGIGANIGLGGGLDVNAGLGSGLNANVDLGRGIGTNVGLRTGLATNSGLGAAVGFNAGLGGDTTTNMALISGQATTNTGNVINTNLGTDLGVNVGYGGRLGTDNNLGGWLGGNNGLGGGVGLNAGLGAGLDANVGLLGGQNTNIGLGNVLSNNIGFGRGLNANIGSIGGANVGLGSGLDANVGLGGGLNTNIGLGTGLGINAGLGTATGINTGLGTIAGVNTNLGQNIGINAGLGPGLGMNTGLGGNANLGGGLMFQGFGSDPMQGMIQDEGFTLSRNKRSAEDLDTAVRTSGLGRVLETGEEVPIATSAGLGLNSGTILGANAGLGAGLDANVGLGGRPNANIGLGVGLGLNAGLGAGLDANVGLGRGPNANIGLGTGLGINNGFGAGLGVGQAGFGVGQAGLAFSNNAGLFSSQRLDQSSDTGTNLNTNVDLQSTVKGSNSNTQLSVLNVFPLILANKLYQSTALYTSISMVGVRKIINLISQAMASEFGLPIASVFLRSYSQFYVNNLEKSFEISVVGLSKATTEALAGTGFLNYKISVSTANQLADAIVSKFSSLIATSLEAKDCATKPQWTYLLNQDMIQPPFIPGYNTYSNSLPNSLMK